MHGLRADRGGWFASGCIATLADGHVFHAGGRLADALAQVAEACDARGTTVRTLSTPSSIFRDLHGDRVQFNAGSAGTAAEGPGGVRMPEAPMMARVGRRDLAA